MRLFIQFAQEEFEFKIKPEQAEFLSYNMLYLDHQVNLLDASNHLYDIAIKFEQQSKDRTNPQWAVNYYYASILKPIADYFKQMQARKCLLSV